MGSGVGSPEADVVEFPVDSEGDGACFVDAVGADAVVGVVDAVGGGCGFGVGGVDRGGGGPVWQGPVGSAVVVFVDELLQELLQIGEGGWLVGLCSELFLECLLEPLHLALGLGVVGSAVLLGDPEVVQVGFQCGASTLAAATCEADGVDDAVVGECGCGVVALAGRQVERVCDDLGGDASVGGDVEGVAGMIIDPGDDLDVGAGPAVGVGEAVVREVGLPALVGLVGLEVCVGTLGPLLRLGNNHVVAEQDPVDRGPGEGDLVGVFQVPANGLSAGV